MIRGGAGRGALLQPRGGPPRGGRGAGRGRQGLFFETSDFETSDFGTSDFGTSDFDSKFETPDSDSIHPRAGPGRMGPARGAERRSRLRMRRSVYTYVRAAARPVYIVRVPTILRALNEHCSRSSARRPRPVVRRVLTVAS